MNRSFHYLNPLLRTGAEKPLESADLGEPLPIDEAKFVVAKLQRHWSAERAKAKPSLGRALVSAEAAHGLVSWRATALVRLC